MSTVVGKRANLVANEAITSPLLVGFPIGILIQIAMVVIPAIIQCMKERSAAEVKSRVTSAYDGGKYEEKLLNRISLLVKFHSVGKKYMSPKQCKAFAAKLLDDARTAPEAELSAMIVEVEAPMLAHMATEG